MGNSFNAEVKAGNLSRVRRFIDKGANIEKRNYSGHTPLIIAAEYGHLEIVRLLLQQGANINAVNEFGVTAMMLAAQYDRFKVVKLLLLKGADLSIVDMMGRCAYSMALKGLSRDLIHAAVDEKRMPEDDTSSMRSFEIAPQNSPYISVVTQVSAKAEKKKEPLQTPPVTDSLKRELGPATSPIAHRSPSSLLEVGREELEISDRICSGGFSTVYKGEWRGTMIAVKVLRCEVGDKAFSSLETELSVLSTLRHPRILTLMGVCRNLNAAEGTVALLMELMERGSLYSILHDSTDNPWAPTTNIERLRLAVDVADGMRFLHYSNVVHRDLKSGNVLVGSDGRAKIADFGLSSYHQLARSHVTNVMGTPAWSAPEVIRGEEGLTPACDVFSFGVILWELLTGKAPWAGKSTVQIIYMSMQGTPLTVPTGLCKEAPELATMIARCLEFRPERRPTFNDVSKFLSVLLTTAAAEKVAPPNVYIPDSFICCISYEIMTDPVICADGHTYEKKNIETWLLQSNRSPKTNLVLEHKGLIPNFALKELLLDSKLR